MERTQRIPAGEIDPLVVSIYPAGDSRYEFREDEGTTEFQSLDDENELVFQWDSELTRRLVLSFHSPHCSGVAQAKIDGHPLLTSEIPWYVESDKLIVSLAASKRGLLHISLKSKR